MFLPANVRYCMDTLSQAGYACYAVGGCVRDALLGRTPHDYDLCTSATPAETARLFSGHTLVRSGEKHGTIGVVIDGAVYEITTFRTEGGYQDSRHPDWVAFVTNLEEDLSRRDFTVNAMAYSPKTGLVDPFGGQADLKNHILRAVGDPKTRFTEDALRILRGVRFAVRFRLIPEEATHRAMVETAPLMDSLARERVFEELNQLLCLVSAADLLAFEPILTQALPVLKPCVGFQQHSPHHMYDVFTHTAQVTAQVPAQPELRWAALLHDVGKPLTFSRDETGQGHFYGHAKVSSLMAGRTLLELKAPSALRKTVESLIDHHMTPLEPDSKLLRKRLSRYGSPFVWQLLALQKADFGGKGQESSARFAKIEALLAEIQAEKPCLSLRDLAINGHDLMALGYEGPTIGKILNRLLELVLEEAVPNEKEALLKKIKEFSL